METIVHIQDNKIVNKTAIRKAFTLPNGKYSVKITKANKRSLMQNAYYWGVLIPFCLQGLRDAGYNDVKTSEDTHEILKHLFLKKIIRNEKTDEEIILPGSTTKLSTVDFMTFISDVQQWASEYLGIYIPSPNEQLELL
jgi:hypothetical protein